MNLTRIVLAGLTLTLVSSATLAQQSATGTVTTIDRIRGVVAIRQNTAPGSTVGANTGGASQQFKVQVSLLDTLHAGDQVTFSFSEADGTKTITKLDRQ